MSNWKKGQTLNNGQYIIESILLRNSCGFDYRAKNLQNGQLVTIKAIDMFWKSQENGEVLATKLIQQAQQIANNCQNPNIITLYPQVFLENDSAYMVMDYLEGIDLATYLDRYGKLDPYEALTLITKVASAINILHQNRSVHQDIKPQNIIIEQETNNPILADYGFAIKMFALGSKKIFNTMTDCFSPPEEVSQNVKIRPNTDIYSLAATLYVLVTSQLPTPSKFREYKELTPPQQFNSHLSDTFNQAILKGMELNPEIRPQFLRDWFQLFKEENIISTQNTIIPNNIISTSSVSSIIENDETIVQANNLINVPPTITKPKTNYPNIDKFTFETFILKSEKKLFGFISNIKKEIITKTGQFFVEYIGKGVNLDMIFIPSGSFMMGSNNNEIGRDKDENPQHLVTFNNPFYISKYPITQLQWRTISSFPKVSRPVKSNPSFYKGDNLPVEKISWFDAQEFCKRLTKYTGRTYRTPTESEWEYACRGNTETSFFFGDIINHEVANYDARSDHSQKNIGKYEKKTTPVDQFYPNPFGLYDLHGNVWEWCEDHYVNNYIYKPKDGSAYHASLNNQGRVVRGGSWSLSQDYCRSAKRGNYSPDSNYNFIGFRVVCVIDN